MTVALMTLVALATGCDTGLENHQLGVITDDRGGIHILYVGCVDCDERVLGVEVVRARGSLGGGDDITVWSVKSPAGVGRLDLKVGEESGTSTERVDLLDELSGEYTVVVESNTQGKIAQGIHVPELRIDRVETGRGGLLTKERFEREARDSCR